MKHWKTISALVFMALAIYFDWQWFWAIFILLGLMNMIKCKRIHFVEEVSQDESPKLYWTMIVIWSVLSLYSILNYLQVLT